MLHTHAPGVRGMSRQSVGWGMGAGAGRGAGLATGAGGGMTTGGLGAQLDNSAMVRPPQSAERVMGRRLPKGIVAKNGARAIAFIASLWNEGAPKTSRQTEPRR